MRVVVIGGTGHIGTYLVPRLVDAGAQVICVSRRRREPYRTSGLWNRVTHVELDRTAEEQAGAFGDRIAALAPDVVIDLICYTLESTQQLATALRGRVQHFLHCGTIWVHGPSVRVPTTEEEPRRPFGDYGCRKAAIEAYLIDEARRASVSGHGAASGAHRGTGLGAVEPGRTLQPAGILRPRSGNGSRDPEPGHGDRPPRPRRRCRAVLRSRDVAPERGGGRELPRGLARRVDLRGYAERMAAWFGREPQLRFLPWEEWRATVSEKEASATWDHIAHSPNCSIRKAEQLLGYQPRYTSLEAVQESVAWLSENGKLAVS